MAEPLTSHEWRAAWLQNSDHDFETADRALHARFPITDTAAHHCQAAEKTLKAFLGSRFEPLVKIPDLMHLLTRGADAEVRLTDWADRRSELSAFGQPVSFKTPEYAANADGAGTLRIMDAIHSLGFDKQTGFHDD